MPKISAYPDGGEIVATDKFVIARAGANKSILGDKIIPNLKVTVYTAGAGNHVPDATTRYMEVEAVGGGGGGGGADGAAGNAGCGGGGCGGGYCYKSYLAPLAASYAYSVGGGGAGGAAGNNPGTAGTPTTFGVMSAKEGTGGLSMAAGTTTLFTDGVVVGVSTGGDVNGATQPGVNGIRLDASTACGGAGGVSAFGAGGRGRSISAVGAPGQGKGGGGGGAMANNATDRAGGAGTDGIIIVKEYS